MSVHSAHQDGLVPPIATRVKAKMKGWAMECMSQDPHRLELQLGDETRCPASLALFSDPSAHTSVEQEMFWGGSSHCLLLPVYERLSWSLRLTNFESPHLQTAGECWAISFSL